MSSLGFPRVPADLGPERQDNYADWLRPDPGSNVININGDDGSVDIADPEEQQEPKAPFLKGEFDANLAEDIDEFILADIASKLMEGIDSDILSRKDWEGIAAKAIDYLGIKLEEASSDITPEGTVSKVFHTLLLESAVYFWANAHAELLPSDGPVKVKNASVPPPEQNGQPMEPPDPTNQNDLAQALETDMNNYLTIVDRGYYRDFSRMLFSLGPMGTEFRKVYWCPIRRRPVSEWVKCRNLIVSNEATDLSTAGRITEKLMMRHATLKRLQYSGWWRDVTVTTPNPQPTSVEKSIAATEGISLGQTISADFQHTIYESRVELDLYGYEHEEEGEKTGLPLPYRVTVDKDSKKILEIRRNWKEGDQSFRARIPYVTYGLIPGLGFYYLGFIHVLGNTQRALTAMERQLLDAGQYSNFPGFVYKKGSIRAETNQVRVPPGGGKEIETGDQSIQNVIMPLPYKDMSAGLLSLMDKIAADGRKLSSIAEMPVGEGRADVPVGTVVAMIEQTQKVMGAVHKGLHASMQDELMLLKEQFEEDPEALWAFAKSPARKWEQAQEIHDMELVPASDPNIPSQLHRQMLNTALLQIAQMAAPTGLLDMKEILDRAFRVLNVPNIDKLFLANPQPPAPDGKQGPTQDPNIEMAKINLQQVENQRKAAAEERQAQLSQWELQQRMDADKQDRMLKLLLAQMQQQTAGQRVRADMAKNQQSLAHERVLTHHETVSERANAEAQREHEKALETQRGETQLKVAKNRAQAKPKKPAKKKD